VFHDWSCLEIAARVRSGDVSAREVVAHHLERIAGHAHLNAFITVADAEQALRDADAVDPAAPLAGVPFAPKDLLDTAGLRTTYGSSIYRDHVPQRTASSITALTDAGAVIVGKANLHEFAWGITSRNPHFGAVVNPRRPDRIPGGSSGGSAAAVAAGLAAISLGTDTGGSIRIPSFACGTAGYKPSYGLVPLDGCYPLVPRMDHIGPMARTMAECALAMEVLADIRATPRLAGLRVGVLHEIEGVSRLTDLGAHVEEAALPDSEALLPMFAAWCADSHYDQYRARRDEYSPDLRVKFDWGFSVTAADFLHLIREYDRWRERCEQALPHDVLVNPTVPIDLPLRDDVEDADLRLRATRYTRPMNFLGWPSATTTDGTMFTGRDDATVLGAALAWEAAL
jgi:aspartyl-tRNA(Asn)/glutamyl-tRNA(Gln) amidotransferase subunit A